MTLREGLEHLVSEQEYRLKQAVDAWERCLVKIRDNPNALDVRGSQTGNLLAEMGQIRVLVAERDRQLADTREFIAELPTELV